MRPSEVMNDHQKGPDAILKLRFPPSVPLKSLLLVRIPAAVVLGPVLPYRIMNCPTFLCKGQHGSKRDPPWACSVAYAGRSQAGCWYYWLLRSQVEPLFSPTLGATTCSTLLPGEVWCQTITAWQMGLPADAGTRQWTGNRAQT